MKFFEKLRGIYYIFTRPYRLFYTDSDKSYPDKKIISAVFLYEGGIAFDKGNVGRIPLETIRALKEYVEILEERKC